MSVTVTQHGGVVVGTASTATLTIDLGNIADATIWDGNVIIIEGADTQPYSLTLDDSGTKYSGQGTGTPYGFYLNVEAVSAPQMYPVVTGIPVGNFSTQMNQCISLINNAHPTFKTILKSYSSSLGTVTLERTATGVAGDSTQNSIALAGSFTAFGEFAGGVDETTGTVTRNIEDTHKIQGGVIGILTGAGSVIPSAGDVIYRVKAVGMELGKHLDLSFKPLSGDAVSAFHFEMGDTLDGPFTSVTIAAGSGTNGSAAPVLAYWERT